MHQYCPACLFLEVCPHPFKGHFLICPIRVATVHIAPELTLSVGIAFLSIWWYIWKAALFRLLAFLVNVGLSALSDRELQNPSLLPSLSAFLLLSKIMIGFRIWHGSINHRIAESPNKMSSSLTHHLSWGICLITSSTGAGWTENFLMLKPPYFPFFVSCPLKQEPLGLKEEILNSRSEGLLVHFVSTDVVTTLE